MGRADLYGVDSMISMPHCRLIKIIKTASPCSSWLVQYSTVNQTWRAGKVTIKMINMIKNAWFSQKAPEKCEGDFPAIFDDRSQGSVDLWQFFSVDQVMTRAWIFSCFLKSLEVSEVMKVMGATPIYTPSPPVFFRFSLAGNITQHWGFP